MYSRPQKLGAELFGTFAVVLISSGAICADQFFKSKGGSGLGPLGIALAYGLSSGVFIASTAGISGGHLNPAVTIGSWVTRRMGLFDMLTYCAAQLAGASAGAYLLRSVVPEETWRAVALGTPDLASGLTRAPGMLIEGVLTMFLVFVFFVTTFGKPDPRPVLTGVATGLLITVASLFGGPFTGAAMNPARVFGPALVARRWTNHGVYWVGPLAGGAAGAVLYGLIFPQHRPKQS